MRTYIFYRPQSEHRRTVEEFLHEFTRRTGRELETIDPDTPSGGALAETYDVVEYPTVITTADDGSELNRWRGMMPTISEVSLS